MRSAPVICTLLLMAAHAFLALAGQANACEECKAITAQSLVPKAISAVWSDPAGWPNGRLPTVGETVTIESGTTMLLDVDTPVLGGLLIKGTLRFADTADRHLKTGWIAVMGVGALLEIGTEAVAYNHRATITLYGTDRDANVMGSGILAMGTKFLTAQDGGTLSLHGASRAKRSWTQLNGHLEAGTTSVTVADVTGWVVGDRIAIAPSGFIAEEAEDAIITSVSSDGLTFGLNRAATYRHWGTILTVEGRSVDMRAEVGLLSRNLIIEGATDSDAQKFGGHTMVMPGGTATVEGVEFRRMGQAGKKGRYPMHWHVVDRIPHNGVTGYGQYVKNCSSHHNYQRAYAVHGTNGVTVQNNVAYHISNHAYVVSEDGDDRDVVIRDNLAILVRTPDSADFAFPVPDGGPHNSTQSEGVSSAFWMRNPNNTFVGNHAAGVAAPGNGFFFDGDGVPTTIDGANVRIDAAPDFSDNVAHSIGGNLAFVMVGYPTPGHFGFVQHTMQDGTGLLAMRNCLAYKCENAGFWFEQDHVALIDSVTADCSAGAAGDAQSALLKDNLFVGRSANTISEPDMRPAVGVTWERVMGGTFRAVGNTFFNTTTSAYATIDGAFYLAPGAFLMGNTYRGTIHRMFTVTSESGWADTGWLLDWDGALDGTGQPSLIGRSISSASVLHPDWSLTALPPNNDGLVGFGAQAWSTPLAGSGKPAIRFTAPAEMAQTTGDVTFTFAAVNLQVGTNHQLQLSISGTQLSTDPWHPNMPLTSVNPVTVTNLAPGVHLATVQVLSMSDAFITEAHVLFSVGEPNSLMPAINPGSVVSGLDYQVFRGDFPEMPDFDSLTPVESGSVDTLVLVKPSENAYAGRYRGFLRVSADGPYTFGGSADDQALVLIDGRVVFDARVIPAPYGTIRLQAGFHVVEIRHYKSGFDGGSINLEWFGPGFSQQSIPPGVWFRTPSAPPVAGGPSITISGPSDGMQMARTFSLAYAVENWVVAAGGRHLHWYVDGVEQGMLTTVAPLTVGPLEPGAHTIRLALAEANHALTGVFDSVSVTVLSSGGATDGNVGSTPSITITSPAPGASVPNQFDVAFTVANWPMAPGGKNLHWFVDGIEQGTHSGTDALRMALGSGTHRITLRLAEANGTLIDAQASVTVAVGSGSGSSTNGSGTGIASGTSTGNADNGGGGGGCGLGSGLACLGMLMMATRLKRSSLKAGTPD